MKALHIAAAIALAALIVLQAAPGRAQALDKPDPSVRAWLPGCRGFLEHPESGGSEASGLCAGAVDALLYIGEVLEPDYRFCVPLRTPRQEIISTILEDIEALRPEADRQDFKGMVLGILRFHWPCRE
jgi:hypothetical protein